jgi:hypothetical protein
MDHLLPQLRGPVAARVRDRLRAPTRRGHGGFGSFGYGE